MDTFLKTSVAVTGFYLYFLTPAFADMLISFDEGAPKDRFTFTNSGNCTIEAATVKLDLSSSKAGLIFDVTENGEGVEVFQPLEITSRENALLIIPKANDGDNQINLDINQLKAGQNISFTIDVDDTTGEREIIVSGAEIAGATVSFIQSGKSVSSIFGPNARTTIKLKACELP
ncbi:MAG: hypothetical protein ACI8P9_004714 [Parasphingorhabdus sp.]|jgi:hypothetical protein